MKKHVFGRQLSRDINERKALFKGLINSLVMQESIQTTEAKAKSIRGQVEKLITKAKRKNAAAKSLLQPWLQKDALEKVMNDLSVRFADRPGGYTRIMKLGERFGDNASMVVIEFVEKGSQKNEKTKSSTGGETVKATARLAGSASSQQASSGKAKTAKKAIAKKEVKKEEKKSAKKGAK